jgi:hypothetical protein
MNNLFVKLWVLSIFLTLGVRGQEMHLPRVFAEPQADFISLQLKKNAQLAHDNLRFTAPVALDGKARTALKNKIALHTGVDINHDLPLLLLETGKVQADGFQVKNIRFQTRPEVYATASLYVPDGTGTFPAVVVTHGHWPDARRAEIFQSVAQALARSGYVVLVMDAWGTGERCSIAGKQEYHGANLGASLMNVGESLLGMQLSDNIRAVDLLSSLKYVDKNNIGATGASGGGNQTMWLAAMDERVKAAIPVVSVGTFEAYILNSNCVCELLPFGLTFTEEAAVLGLVAPRALKIFSAGKEANKAFMPAEMLKSYEQASLVYKAAGAKDKLAYQIFDAGHGYWPEMREAMLGWFNLQLKGKGDGSEVKEPAIKLLSADLLKTYADDQREPEVLTTAGFSKLQGNHLNQQMRAAKIFNAAEKRSALKGLLAVDHKNTLKKIHQLGEEKGWFKYFIETSNGSHIPFLLKRPVKHKNSYTLLSHSSGKDSIPAIHLQKLIDQGEGIVLIDVWGTGEQASPSVVKVDGALPPFHTLSRSALWLGNTIQGKWLQDLQIVSAWLKQQNAKSSISVQGYKETGLAALFYGVFHKTAKVTLYNTPFSYQFDEREGIDYYNMAVHIPGILKWGDISMAAALAQGEVIFNNPRSMSGKQANKQQISEVQAEIKRFNRQQNKKQMVQFKESTIYK